MFKNTRILLLLSLAHVGAFAQQPAATPSVAPVVATQVLKTSESWDGKPVAFPSGRGEVTALSIQLQPGAETGWHLHPVPSFAVVVQGTLEVTLRDGRTRRFNAGEAFAEVVNTEHNGRNPGATPTQLLVLYTGAQGATLTVKH